MVQHPAQQLLRRVERPGDPPDGALTQIALGAAHGLVEREARGLQRLGEVYDDHQAEITEAFVKRGLVLSANSVEELKEALQTAQTRKRVVATTEPTGLSALLTTVLERLPRRA